MSWREQAACLGSDPDIFFPEHNGKPGPTNYDKAKAICADCVVVEDCLEDALDRGRVADMSGVRGGFTAQERQNIRWNRNRRRRLETA